MKKYETLKINVCELDKEDIIMSVSTDFLNAHDTDFGAGEFFND